mmetsp:Transcript_12203/g.22185  ORF Transcript_12203/g.22185 Transcript_12203/m.22185 type:complete len:206 (+) Transcript_12203:1134-1751(+)
MLRENSLKIVWKVYLFRCFGIDIDSIQVGQLFVNIPFIERILKVHCIFLLFKIGFHMEVVTLIKNLYTLFFGIKTFVSRKELVDISTCASRSKGTLDDGASLKHRSPWILRRWTNVAQGVSAAISKICMIRLLRISRIKRIPVFEKSCEKRSNNSKLTSFLLRWRWRTFSDSVVERISDTIVLNRVILPNVDKGRIFDLITFLVE